MEIKGSITFETVSGGFWGIISEDGRRFRPVEGIPQAFQQSGLAIRATVEPADTFSIYMWGKEVHLIAIAHAE